MVTLGELAIHPLVICDTEVLSVPRETLEGPPVVGLLGYLPSTLLGAV